MADIITYLESYLIPGLGELNIEDYNQSGDHFMPEKKHKRFQCWSGGCGIGQYDTLDVARQNLFRYARDTLLNKESTLIENLHEIRDSLDKLSKHDHFKLARFLTEES
jgi:hypothetical protein